MDLLLGGNKSGGGGKMKGLFGKFKGGKKVFDGGSCRFSPSSISISSCHTEERVKNGDGVKLKSNASFSTSHAKSSPLWVSFFFFTAVFLIISALYYCNHCLPSFNLIYVHL